jgi:transcriptional regulator with XRE-family HTH domain
MTEPGGRLRAARTSRGWSQARATEELTALARERGLAVAAPASLKTQLSRWENQHAVPEEQYRQLLCDLYECGAAELGLVTEDPIESTAQDAQLRAKLAESAAVDEPAVELLRAQFEATRRLDRRLGASASAGATQAQLSYLETVLIHSLRREIRQQLAVLVAECSLLAGEHSLDELRHSDAWQHFTAAKVAAREADSTALAGYATARQAALLADLGEHESSITMIGEAIKHVEPAESGPLVAWLNATRGQALAAGGAPEQVHSAYQLAERQLRASDSQIDIAYPESRYLTFDLAALQRHRGHTWLMMNEDAKAIDDLESSLERALDSAAARETASVHVDLAYAHGSVGHASAAADHAGQARDLITQIGSARLARRLDERRAQPVGTC